MVRPMHVVFSREGRMAGFISQSARLLSGAFLVVAITLASGASGVAQTGAASAALNGLVSDNTGAVIPGASIILRNTTTGFEQITKSNGSGKYSIENIAPGSYTVHVTMPGFATMQSEEFKLAVNQTGTLNFTLKVGTANTTVTVSANAVQLET